MAPVHGGPRQSLREALVKTYATNPTLMAQRQSLRATDESVDIARAAGRPQVSATAGFNQDVVTTNIQGANGRDFSVGASVSLPLYLGRPGPQFGPRRQHPRRGRPRRPARDRGRHLHRGGRRLHGRDSRPLDRSAQPEPGPRPRDQLAGDPRPLRGRRPHPHRRRPVRRPARAGAQQPRPRRRPAARPARRITGG